MTTGAQYVLVALGIVIGACVTIAWHLWHSPDWRQRRAADRLRDRQGS